MIPKWSYLKGHNRSQFDIIVAFLDKRMTESKTIAWAINLKPDDYISRIALQYLIYREFTDKIDEPWSTAWRLIEESWNEHIIAGELSAAMYDIQSRLKAGETSGKLVLDISEQLSPRLIVESNSSKKSYKNNRKINKLIQLLHSSISSEKLPRYEQIFLDNIYDIPFLMSLVRSLESNINKGLDIGRRIDCIGNKSHWVLGLPSRVYYVYQTDEEGAQNDPDEYKKGIAPSVKVLFKVVKRIVELSPSEASRLISYWRLNSEPIFIRLWAAAARDKSLVSVRDLREFLINLKHDQFWDLYNYPEIAELRAIRFGELDTEAQSKIVNRIRKLPPRNQCPKKKPLQDLANFQLYSALQEMQRIKLSGVIFLKEIQFWIDSNLESFEDLKNINLTSGFPEGTQLLMSGRPKNPDKKYNHLGGVARLKALEMAFTTPANFWEESPTDGARYWLQEAGNISLIIKDFMETTDGGSDFPYIWEQIGWNYYPNNTIDQIGGIEAILSLLSKIKENTLEAAIKGICELLYSCRLEKSLYSINSVTWQKIWPIAVSYTNKSDENHENNIDLSVSQDKTNEIRRDTNIDILNPPVGKLISIFLEMCPSELRKSTDYLNFIKVRDLIISADGRSGLVVKCRFISDLPYFLNLDKTWATQHLVMPLHNNDSEAFSLWRELAKRTQFNDVIKIIGDEILNKAADRGLERQTRKGLVFSLIAESLHAFREGRNPAIANAKIQQMLRVIDDELRVEAALVVQRFVREMSSKPEATAADLFRTSAIPFLREVWPQERSLVTPSITSAFASLPATSEKAFSEAVSCIERFLIPFECWALHSYGLNSERNLSIIDNAIKAKSLLTLLDLTVGSSEQAIIPNDLTKALDRIRELAPKLLESPSYRRLATIARR